MKRFRFWFDAQNFGIAVGHTMSEAFETFRKCGFIEDDIFEIEVEECS